MLKGNELIEKYKEYAETEEAYAVLFVKKHLNASKGNWVDILNTNVPGDWYMDDLEFQSVECELFKRKIHPVYPKKSSYMSDEDYYNICRAITWNTAHTDIAQQRRRGVKGLKFRISGKKVYGDEKIYTLSRRNFKKIKKTINDLRDDEWDYVLLQGIDSYGEYDDDSYKYSCNNKNFKNMIHD
ncbi:hypothetical protein H8356DRAFT_1667456 [Neocallimastix lanati (nom. inval.)]|nr:hypothetical protein H8356DRAFT_1667456 [Neocallimastix sp. JGI-2020a]